MCIRDRDIPVLSQIPIIGPLLFTRTYITTWVVLLILAIFTFLLYKTSFGLRLRACGEHPQAAAAAGVNVYKMRYIGCLLYTSLKVLLLQVFCFV